MDTAQRLRQSALFQDLDADEFEALTRIVSVRRVDKDQILFFEGDPAPGFFVLLTGGVRIYKASPDGKEYTLHIIHPGQVFAEAAIFKGNTYPANCMALEDSEVAFLPKTEFIRLVQSSPQIALKMIASLSAWLREFARKLEELSLKEVSARLAAYILAEVKNSPTNAFELDITKAQLASRLGTISETLSRNLKKFRDLGAITVSGKQITVLNSSLLKNIASGEKI